MESGDPAFLEGALVLLPVYAKPPGLYGTREDELLDLLERVSNRDWLRLPKESAEEMVDRLAQAFEEQDNGLTRTYKLHRREYTRLAGRPWPLEEDRDFWRSLVVLLAAGPPTSLEVWRQHIESNPPRADVYRMAYQAAVRSRRVDMALDLLLPMIPSIRKALEMSEPWAPVRLAEIVVTLDQAGVPDGLGDTGPIRRLAIETLRCPPERYSPTKMIEVLKRSPRRERYLASLRDNPNPYLDFASVIAGLPEPERTLWHLSMPATVDAQRLSLESAIEQLADPLWLDSGASEVFQRKVSLSKCGPQIELMHELLSQAGLTYDSPFPGHVCVRTAAEGGGDDRAIGWFVFRHRHEEGEIETQTQLATVIDFGVDNERLADVVDRLQDVAKIDVVPLAGANLDIPVTIAAGRLSLRGVLDRIATQTKQEWDVVPGGVIFGRPDEMARHRQLASRFFRRWPVYAARAALGERVSQALRMPITVDFLATPLKDVVDFIEKYAKTKVVVDVESLTDLGIDAEAGVTSQAFGLSLGRALTLALAPLGLGWEVEHGTIWVGTPSRAMKLRNMANDCELKLVQATTAGRDRAATGALEPIDFDFVETPLDLVVDYLRQVRKVTVWIDLPSMRALSIDSDTPVTYRMSGISLGWALTLLMEPMGLTWDHAHGTIWIGSPERAADLRRMADRFAAQLAREAPTAGSTPIATATIRRPLTLDVQKTPLVLFAEHLRKEFGAQIVLDAESMKKLDRGGETLLDFKVREVALGWALWLALEPIGLAWDYDEDGTIFIGSSEAVRRFREGAEPWEARRRSYPQSIASRVRDRIVIPRRDVSGEELAASLARLVGTRVVFVGQPTPRKSIGTESAMPLDRALDEVSGHLGIRWRIEDGTIMLEAPTAQRTSRIVFDPAPVNSVFLPKADWKEDQGREVPRPKGFLD